MRLRKRSRAKVYDGILTPNLYAVLRWGRPFAYEHPPITRQDLRAAWRDHRATIRDKFIADRPGHRPFGEWLCEIAPKFGPRPLIDKLTEGQKSLAEKFGIVHMNCWPPIQESEPEFLARHNLLELWEIEALEGNAECQ